MRGTSCCLARARTAVGCGCRPAGQVLVGRHLGRRESTAATGLVERLSREGYQILSLDPEGDYEAVAGAVVWASAERAARL